MSPSSRSVAARRRRTAIHEAGHAVMCVVSGVGVVKAVVHESHVDGLRGYVTHSGACLHDDVMIAVAGVAAVSIRYREPTWVEIFMGGGSGDWEFAEPLIKSWGCCERQLMREVKWRLRRHWPAVLALADRLLTEGTLIGMQVEDIVNDALRA
jgi:hypothetical protein